ncbi:peptidylprolyl isomerase [Mangrovicella endophytica]|uniref:peptidylprolyl isomerase n=1 Tax=Mangrovicella endophytica TaxID=2066697 RepID=UPI000C9DEA7F|nr:peptidylprolyl isomerase [Mangrovicella endophytica]
MMNALRRAVSGWAAKVLLGLLLISFAVWGIPDILRTRTSNAVVTAGDTRVTLQDYAIAYNQAQARIAQQLQRRPTAEEAAMFGIDQSVLSQLTAGAVLDEQGRRIGLGVSQDELARLVAEDPSFHDANGNFSRSSFQQVLAGARITEGDYIRNRERAAIRSQIVEAVSDGIKLPAAVQTALGLFNGERRTVEYLTVAPALVQPVAAPTPEALQTYFDGKKRTYAAPEFRSIAYAVLTPETAADPAAVTDAEITAAYEKDKARFTVPEKRRVQQIVYSDQAAADAAAAKLAGGATFDTLAQDAGKAIADTDLGLVTRKEIFDPAIAEAAFTLKSGETSGVVKGAFGPVILRVAEVQPEAVKPLDEVREEVRKDVALGKGNDLAVTAYDAFEDARAGGASFDEAAATAKLKVVTLPAVDAQGNGPDDKPIADLPAGQDLLSAVFESEPEADNQPVRFGSAGSVFFEVRGITPARDRTLDEVKERVTADWTADETARLLGERVDAMKKAAEGGKTLDQIAAEVKLTKQTAASVTRQSAPAELGQAATAAAFSGGKGSVATAPATDGQSQILLKVTEVAPPADPNASVQPGEREQLADMMRNDLLQSYIAMLQGSYSVSVYPAAIDQAKAAIR